MKQFSVLLQAIHVDQTRGGVHLVWHGLKVHGSCRNLLLTGHEPVGQMTTVRQVQPHDATVGPNEGGVHCKVRWRARVGLDVDAPFCGV